ncbi:uncharacterized protein LOC129032866 [Pongo pygmaeus]|uniref:uncharacterized protein LOC129032866 n=1 Tax=Pongo pygmaeus TaxID=9600 RepID=UPI0023E164B4|nr:uncharacterized protein LOC129032866 [Pongo pygmaeus]
MCPFALLPDPTAQLRSPLGSAAHAGQHPLTSRAATGRPGAGVQNPRLLPASPQRPRARPANLWAADPAPDSAPRSRGRFSGSRWSPATGRDPSPPPASPPLRPGPQTPPPRVASLRPRPPSPRRLASARASAPLLSARVASFPLSSPHHTPAARVASPPLPSPCPGSASHPPQLSSPALRSALATRVTAPHVSPASARAPGVRPRPQEPKVPAAPSGPGGGVFSPPVWDEFSLVSPGDSDCLGGRIDPKLLGTPLSSILAVPQRG